MLNRLLADTESNTSQLILRDGVPVAVMIITQTHPEVIDIPLFRIKRGFLASTIARFAISLLFDISIKNKYSMLRIGDKFLAEVVEDALPEAGFFLDDAVWTKINVYAIGHPIVIEEQLRILMDKLGHQVFESKELPMLVNNLHNQSSVPQILEAEQYMKPAKLLAGNIPTFVLPIKPQWAVHLFDARLADQTLFGAREDLMLSWENVYYRYPNKPSGFDGTFRILWYVSGDRRYLGSGAIRAYSLETNAEILPASHA
ncbi:MAG: hypothetical protein IIC24_12615, partial [Chloroflexi bacterium]|nr:hypothetical protein [Chloroflexota bacterium]